MSKINLKLPKAHSAQQIIDESDARFIIAVCGRRFGKTSSIIRKRIREILGGKPGAYFAPSYKMMSEFFRQTVDVLRPVITNISKSENRLEFIGGGSLVLWSLENFESIRGQKYAYADIDEAAMCRHLEEAWNAVIRPTLSDYQGKAGFWSTPKGINFFHKLYVRGLDDNYPDWESFQFPTAANPFINPNEIEAARHDLPEEIFRQEYLAEFLSGEGQVFRNIKACLTSTRSEPSQHKGHRIVAGVDWGQVADFTAISVLCEDCCTELELDRFNQIDWEFQRRRILEHLEKWNVSFCLVEENSIGSPNLEALQKATGRTVKGFTTTAQSKTMIIQSLALGFEQAETKWLDVPYATAELESYEAKRSEVTNRISYGHPVGGHDDTVMARALAREAIEMKKRGLWKFSEFRF